MRESVRLIMSPDIILCHTHKGKVSHMKEDFNFFGVPDENIQAAQRRKSSGCNQQHIAVPSRKDVATLPPAKLKALLLAWMENSATEIIPSRAQISLVKEVLKEREDVSQIEPIIAMCTHFIEGA